MVHEYEVSYDNILLRQIKVEDIEFLRKWRNDKIETRFLTPIEEISTEQQIEWYNNYLNNNTEIGFAIVETKKLNRIVGSVSLYDIDYKQKICEIGKIRIGDKEAHGLGLGKKALVLCCAFGFEKISLEKIYSNVHKDNFSALKNDIDVGFQIKKVHPSIVGGEEFYIEMTKDRLKCVNNYIELIKYKF